MALPMERQARYWGIAAAVFLVVMFLLGDVILPFVAGGAIAYFLDPVADQVERMRIGRRRRLGRTGATVVIALLMFLMVGAIFLAVIPTLVEQGTALVNAAPDIFRQFYDFLTARFPQLADQDSSARQTLADLGETIRERGGEFVQAILGGAMGIINAVVFIVVVPVVSFYMLLDWDRAVARIDGLLPRDHAPTIRRLAREVDDVLAAFVRGQLSVCLIMGVFYAVTLMIAGLQFGVFIGALAGAITFIPYVGSLVGGALAIGLGLFQFWGDWVQIGIIAGIFALGQFLENNIITPKLVGESVGLHPVWLLFALAVFGALFGFLGLLVAVPVAAAIGVLVRFALERYRDSVLYQGEHAPVQVEVDVAVEVTTGGRTVETHRTFETGPEVVTAPLPPRLMPLPLHPGGVAAAETGTDGT